MKSAPSPAISSCVCSDHRFAEIGGHHRLVSNEVDETATRTYFPLLVTATLCIRRHHSLNSIDSFSVGRELGHSSSSLSKSRSLVATNVDSSLGIVSVIGHKMLPKLNAHSVTPTAQPRSRSLDRDAPTPCSADHTVSTRALDSCRDRLYLRA